MSKMPTAFGSTLIASLFIICTSLSLGAGLAMIITGIVIQMRFNIFLGFIGSKYNVVAIMLILIGSIIFLSGALGTFGTLHENQLMLSEFVCLLMTIVAIEALLFLDLIVNRVKLDMTLREVMLDSMVNYNNDGSAGVTFTWDIIHKQLQCCGTNGLDDWAANRYLIRRSVPDSCCKIVKADCGKGLLSKRARDSLAHNKGCFDAVKNKLMFESSYLIVGIALIMILQLLMCMLACIIRFELEQTM